MCTSVVTNQKETSTVSVQLCALKQTDRDIESKFLHVCVCVDWESERGKDDCIGVCVKFLYQKETDEGQCKD